MEEKRILVIDDDSGIGEMLQVLLEFNGYKVSVTEKPEEAEDIIQDKNIDLVLLDMLISGINGTDVCQRLRSNDDAWIAEIPILMMSALHDAGEKCRNAGANDFIAKPFEIDDLTNMVDDILKNSN